VEIGRSLFHAQFQATSLLVQGIDPLVLVHETSARAGSRCCSNQTNAVSLRQVNNDAVYRPFFAFAVSRNPIHQLPEIKERSSVATGH